MGSGPVHKISWVGLQACKTPNWICPQFYNPFSKVFEDVTARQQLGLFWLLEHIRDTKNKMDLKAQVTIFQVGGHAWAAISCKKDLVR